MRHLSGGAPFLFSLLLHSVVAAGLAYHSSETATLSDLRRGKIHLFQPVGAPLEIALLDGLFPLTEKTEPTTLSETAFQEAEKTDQKIINENQQIKRNGSSEKKASPKSVSAAKIKSGAVGGVSGTVPDEGVVPQSARRPDYAYNPPPDYPPALRMRAVEGVVRIRVKIDVEGRPSEVLLAESSGYRLFDDAALQAVRQWRFIPAQNGGQNVSSWVEVPVRFSLSC